MPVKVQNELKKLDSEVLPSDLRGLNQIANCVKDLAVASVAESLGCDLIRWCRFPQQIHQDLQDAFVEQLESHSGAAGWYTCDLPGATRQRELWEILWRFQ